MGFIRQYHKLFSLQAQEKSSQGESPLPGVRFKPTAECRKRLGNHQLVLRQRETGAEVYYQLNPNAEDPVMGKIEKRVSFDFVIHSERSGFSKQYLGGLTKETGPQIFLDNLDANGNIQSAAASQLTVEEVAGKKDAAKFHDSVFHESIDPSTQATSVLIKDRFTGDLMKTVAIESQASPESLAVKIDLSGLANGAYILTTDGNTIQEKNIYIDGEVKKSKPLGLISIHLDRPQTAMPVGGASFTINFQLQ